jgi:hypothetical protein
MKNAQKFYEDNLDVLEANKFYFVYFKNSKFVFKSFSDKHETFIEIKTNKDTFVDNGAYNFSDLEVHSCNIFKDEILIDSI